MLINWVKRVNDWRNPCTQAAAARQGRLLIWNSHYLTRALKLTHLHTMEWGNASMEKKGKWEGELLCKLYQKIPVYPKASCPGYSLYTVDFLCNWKLSHNMWAKIELTITCSIYYSPQVYNLWITAYCGVDCFLLKVFKFWRLQYILTQRTCLWSGYARQELTNLFYEKFALMCQLLHALLKIFISDFLHHLCWVALPTISQKFSDPSYRYLCLFQDPF